MRKSSVMGLRLNKIIVVNAVPQADPANSFDYVIVTMKNIPNPHAAAAIAGPSNLPSLWPLLASAWDQDQ